MACQLLEIEIELEEEYERFIKTDKGKEWIKSWNERMPDSDIVGFGEYLYDFYQEMLMEVDSYDR